MQSGGYDVTDDDDNDDVDDDDDDDDDNNDESNDDNDAYDKCMQSAPPLHVLPLYSLLPIEKQSHVSLNYIVAIEVILYQFNLIPFFA